MIEQDAFALRRWWILAAACWFVLALSPLAFCQSRGGARPSGVQQQQQQQPRRGASGSPQQPVERQADRRNAAGGNSNRAAMPMPNEPRVPDWMPLTKEHQNYINQILAAWEGKSSRINRYHCEFTRWKYDLGFDQAGELIMDGRNEEAASEIVKGQITFEAPDKARFEVKDGWLFVPDTKSYKRATLDEVGQHWICDGQSFFEYVYRQKTIRKFQLPPEAQGEALTTGPLPFLFRAKANDLSNRFWLRIVTPKDEEEAYHLEATPKSKEDAAEFSRVVIILDEEEFLPKAIALFPPGAKPNSPERQLYVFDKRKVNPKLTKLIETIFDKFYEPPIPDGDWKIVQEEFKAEGDRVADERMFDDQQPRQPLEQLDRNIAPQGASEATRQAQRPRARN